MPTMRGMGPSCCCCKDFIRFKENWQASPSTNLLEIVDGVFSNKMFHNSPSDRSQTAIGLDWVNKKYYYAEVDTADAYFRWWKVGQFAGLDGQDAPMTANIVTIEDYFPQSLATDADDEHLYFAGIYGRDWQDGDINYALNIDRMNYDGTGLTTLATIDVYRTTGPGGNSGMIGPMLVNRTERVLFYVVRENYSTADANTWEISLRSRDLATFTENTLTTSLFPGFGAQTGVTYIRQINSLSFDIAQQKIYWVEHYYTASIRHESIVKRANYDGSGVETLYTSTDPVSVNFVRFSNKLQQIIHADYDRTPPWPRDGIWIRDRDWNEIEQIGFTSSPNSDIASPPSSAATNLWCGWETTGAGSKA